MDIGRPVSAWDPQGDTLTYSLGGPDADSFDIDGASGQMVTKEPLDYESKSSYRVIVWVHDGKDQDGAPYNGTDAYQDVIITLTNVDEAGELTLSPDQPHIGTELSAAVDDGDGSVSGEVWGWERSADMSDWSAIAEASSALYTPVEADRGSYLRVAASYTDGHGPGKSASVVSASVVVVNTAPRFPLTELNEAGTRRDSLERMVAENAAPGEHIGAPVAAVDPDGDTPSYRLSGEDAQHFDIEEMTGQLRSSSVFDFEARATYSVIVAALDGKDADGNLDTAVDDSIAVTVIVTNEEEPGNMRLSTAQPSVGSPLVAILADPDGVVGEAEWVWHRSTDPNPVFERSWRVVSGAKTSSYTPVETDMGYYLGVTAAYDDGHGPDKSRQAVSEESVAGSTDLVFAGVSDGVFERSVAENTGAGETVGVPVVATSPNSGALTYALGGADAALFAIDPDTGQIRVGAGTELDYEADKNVYEVAVTAADPSGSSATTVAVTIRVTDVDLGPYDVDNNEVIDRDEALAAVVDYFADIIDKDEAVSVVQLYFTG